MKRTITVLTFALSTISFPAVSQQVFDIVSIGQGYTNQSYYSMTSGELSNVTNTDWDLAFQISGFQASIRINSKNNVRLFRTDLHVNDYFNVSYVDTIGKLNSAFELFNSDTSWWYGAFNQTMDTSNAFDLGWGVYDFATHIVSGDSLFFLMTSSGTVKKFWIESLANGVYNFRYADVDGANEVITSLSKSGFPGKNFGYYSISGGGILDREPLKSSWDLLFTQYLAVTPFTYKVTGVLANDSVAIAEVNPSTYQNASPWSDPYSGQINVIGFDWKSYDLNLNSWVLNDSVIFFVADRSGQIWKMKLTGFGGASTGDYEFVKELVSITSTNSLGENTELLSVYPNPASGIINMIIKSNSSEIRIKLRSLTGQLVKEQSVSNNRSLSAISLETQSIESGLYILTVESGGSAATRLVSISR